MNKNKHLICEKLYKLLLTCKTGDLGMIRYGIKKCRNELASLKPTPFLIKPQEKIIIKKITMNNFLKILNKEISNVDNNTDKKTVPF